MADHQRIHPVDLEAGQRPSAPLVAGNASRSDKGDPALAGRNYYPPPPQRTAPPANLRPPKRRGNCCCRCICCTFLTIVVLVILVAATLGALYLVFDPKVPKYSVDRLAVSAFNIDNSLTAHARFDVTVTAENSNKAIGIYYEEGSSLSVWYEEYRLSEGALPVFYQGHQNKTVLNIVMSGQAQLGSEVMTALQQAEQTGAVPLVFRGDVPVRVKLGSLKLWKVTSRVRCNLVVDSLSVNNQIRIKTSSCKFSLKL